jgi:DNA-binding transcriptional MerR regulator
MQQLDLFSVDLKPESVISKEQIEIAREPELRTIQRGVIETSEPVTTVTSSKKDAPKPVKENKRGRKSYKELDAEIDNVEVPGDDILFQKQYYPISEVANWFHVNPSLIRYWENEFDILSPRKTRKGDRLFRPEDVKNMQIIYFLLRERKFSIEGARQYLRNNKRKADVQMQLIQSLTKLRLFLLEWKVTLGE